MRAVGVLGGMGPAATIDLLQQLATNTPADRDQDHVPVMVHGDPRVPDRTEALLAGGPSPLPLLLDGVAHLDRLELACIVMPCNTAHVWYDQLAAATRHPFLHLVDVTIDRLLTEHPGVRAIGVLSTRGTADSGLYRDRLAAQGLTTIEPTPEAFAAQVSPGIAAVKAGDTAAGRALLVSAGDELVARGAQAIVIACTDISVVITEQDPIAGAPVIDANTSLAHAALAAAADGDDEAASAT